MTLKRIRIFMGILMLVGLLIDVRYYAAQYTIDLVDEPDTIKAPRSPSNQGWNI